MFPRLEMMAVVRRTLALFDEADRRALAALLFIVLASATVDMLGVASIVPFMALVANPAAVERQRALKFLYQHLHLADRNSFLVLVGVVVLATMLASNGLAALAMLRTSQLVSRKGEALSTRLLARYLAEPYAFHLSRNSSELATNILSEVAIVMKSVLLPIITVIAKSAVTIATFLLLILVNPLLAVGIGALFGGTYAAIYFAVRRKQRRLGTIRFRAARIRYRSAAEALGAIKELKILGREAFFVERFATAAEQLSEANISNQVVGQWPKYAIDTLAFGSLLLLMIVMLLERKNVEEILPVVSLYALAGYRIMPALQQIFSSLADMRFNAPALEALHRDLARATLAPINATVPHVAFKRTLELSHVTFAYEGVDHPAVADISLRVERNQSIALIGATGSGKTTTVDIVLGLLSPQSGELLVDGVPIRGDLVAGWQRRIGYVPQHIYLSDDTLRHNVALGIPEHEIDDAAVAAALRIAALDEFVRDLPKGVGTVVGERGVRLSGGQRQRIGIARALYHDPDVLVLDEATSALDGITEAEVVEAIRNLSSLKTMIVIAHRLATVRNCGTVYLFDAGRIIASGSYDHLYATNERVRAMAAAGQRHAPPRVAAVL